MRKEKPSTNLKRMRTINSILMTGKDLLKLEYAGFTILRCEDRRPYRIRFFVSYQAWRVYERFRDLETLQESFNILHQDAEVITDINMDRKDHAKIMAKGFRIIRKIDVPKICIKERDANTQNWVTLQNFETKAARDREVDRLLQSDKTVMD